MMKWIDDIAKNAFELYNGRNIFIWGKYSVSDEIKKELEAKFHIKNIKYIDSDVNKQDGIEIYSPHVLKGRSRDCFVIIPIAFYQSIKDELTSWGYKANQDYYYFCDCVVKQTEEYYEDRHGNKAFGSIGKCKVVFSGFNSTIKICDNAILSGSAIYIHSDAHIDIGNSTILESRITALDGGSLSIGNEMHFMKGSIVAYKNARISIGNCCTFLENDFIVADQWTEIDIGNDCQLSSNIKLQSGDIHSIFDVRTGNNINSLYEISKDRKIIIGEHVWIGYRAIILYYTEIGDGSIIGADALVKGKIPNNCIAAGVPARVIRRDVAWARENNLTEMYDEEKRYARLTVDDSIVSL